MPYILNEDEINRRADIVSVIGRRVPLKPGRSRDHLEGNCPFHASKSGRSFHVYPEKQSWFCWGCHEGGDAAKFLMKLEGITYPEALEVMANECGVIVEYDNTGRRHDGQKVEGPRRQDMSVCLEEACKHYQANLANDSQAIEYLSKRGFGRSAIERWRIGLSVCDTVKAVGDTQTLIAAGILKQSQDGQHVYDPLMGRITIPITDHLGHVIGFTARLMEAVEGRPKYLNTSDTTLFKKGKALFGLAQSKQLVKKNARLAIHIVEGQLKAMAVIENGLPAVAPGGTAFTPDHAALIHSVTSLVAWCPDPDEAGENAVIKGAPVARDAGLDVWIGTLVIPDSIETPVKDPDDLMAMGIPVRYEYQSLVEWLYGRIASGPVSTTQEARRVAEEVVPIIERHPLQAVQFHELKKLSELSGIPESRLKSAKETAVIPVARPVEPQQTEQQPIDTAMPPDRLLFSAILQQGLNIQWQQLIPWWDLTNGQWGVIANITHILGVAARCRVSVTNAIMTAGKPALRGYLSYWALVPEGATADIAALAAQVARANRDQAAMIQAQAGNFQYAQYLKDE